MVAASDGAPDPGTDVRDAVHAERRRIVACLARAFEDDPVSCFLFENPGSRRSRLEHFYREVVRMMFYYGVVQTDAKVQGAAIWRAPQLVKPGRLRALWDATGMLLALRRATPRALRLEQAISGERPHEPHWYLAILGTEPAQQRRGVGSALLRSVLHRCDADRVPAYLESSKEENLAFYERHGFRVCNELRVPGGPTLWSMLRQPLNREQEAAE